MSARGAWWSAPLLALALLSGCGGGSAKQSGGPTSAERRISNPQAVAKLAQGAAAAREVAGLERAAALFRQALVIDPGLWEARFNLGVVLAAAGELDDAAKELARAAKEAPAEESIVVALAEVERRRGRSKEGADMLAAFVKAHPTAAGAKDAYVSALRDSKQYDKALEQARELLLLHPGDAGALAELSLCYLAKGDHETASLVAKQAVDSASKNDAKDPKDPKADKPAAKERSEEATKKAGKAHLASALVAFTRGNDAEAFAAFQKAAELDPRDPTPKMNMGTIFVRAGQYAKAEEQFRGVLAGSRDDIDALLGLAIAQRGQGTPENQAKWAEAKATLERVLVLDKDNPAAHYNLGVLYMYSLKKPAEAKASFQRFLKEAPGSHPQVAEAKKSLVEIDANKGAK